MTETNLIKQVCKDYNLSYEQLAVEVGSTQSTISSSASTGKISKALDRAIKLYIENQNLKKEVEEFNIFKQLMSKIFPQLQK